MISNPTIKFGAPVVLDVQEGDTQAPPPVQATPTNPPPAQAKVQDPAEARREADRIRKANARARKAGKPLPYPEGQATAPKPAKAAKSGQASLLDELDQLGEAYKETNTQAGAPQQPGQPGQGAPAPAQASLVTGYVLIAVMDALFPMLLSMYYRKTRPDVTPDALRLTPKAKESLMPLADAAASRLLGHLDPVVVFLGASAAMYMGNVPPPPVNK